MKAQNILQFILTRTKEMKAQNIFQFILMLQQER